VTKLFIATPAYGEVFYSSYVQSLMRLLPELARRRWDSLYVTTSFSDIAESRNALLTRWFDETDASHLLFIDADMGFEPSLVMDMLELNEPLVGVVAPKRKVDLDRLAQSAPESGNAASVRQSIAQAHEFVIKGAGRGSRNGFIRVEGCGAGILLIRRDCIEKMLQQMPEISDDTAGYTSPLGQGMHRMIRAFEPLRLEQARLSEDFAFCYRWRRRCGGEVWASVDHEITHIGLHKFQTRYSDLSPGERHQDGTAPADVTELPPRQPSQTAARAPKSVSGRLAMPPRKKA